MMRRLNGPPVLGVLLAMSASGCQSAPPLAEATFSEAAKRCHLQATTYTYRNGFLLDEPLVDFSKEAEPPKALKCFNLALEKIDREATARGATHISRIWKYRA
jgi:hypothetical protein